MGLNSQARRLELARDRAADRPAPSLVWSSTDFAVDRAALRPGDRVIADVMYTARRWPAHQDLAVRRERVTRDPDELGRVYDLDGSVVGVVRVGSRGGVLLDLADGGSVLNSEQLTAS